MTSPGNPKIPPEKPPPPSPATSQTSTEDENTQMPLQKPNLSSPVRSENAGYKEGLMMNIKINEDEITKMPFQKLNLSSPAENSEKKKENEDEKTKMPLSATEFLSQLRAESSNTDHSEKKENLDEKTKMPFFSESSDAENSEKKNEDEKTKMPLSASEFLSQLRPETSIPENVLMKEVLMNKNEHEKTEMLLSSQQFPSSARAETSNAENGLTKEVLKKKKNEDEKTEMPLEEPKFSSSQARAESSKAKKVAKQMPLDEKHLLDILKSDDFLKKGTLRSSMSVEKNMVSFGDLVEESGDPVENGKAMMKEAWKRLLEEAIVTFNGSPVGTVAAIDNSKEDLNYNQVFVRDFIPCGLACLMMDPPETEIVRNFLLSTLHLQGWEKRIDNFTMSAGVMPASFKIKKPPKDKEDGKDVIEADFGDTAIGRVSPVDSGFWWIILLNAYITCTPDSSLTTLPLVQNGMKLILDLCLSDGFDTFPTLLCTDGCCMIDRRMGVYGYPIEIQALFYFALRCAKSMLILEKGDQELSERKGDQELSERKGDQELSERKGDQELSARKGDQELSQRIADRIGALSFHVQTYFWLDFTQLNNIYCYKTEEYSKTAVNKFNVQPETIEGWLFDFMPLNGGFFVGNVSPSRMDFRWFLVGNCIAIISSLATPHQATRIMNLIEERWKDLIGEVPLKVVYPALEGEEWRIVTGCDPKNTSWSYHNGGSWPVLIWLLTAASIKAGRPEIAKKAIELLEPRLARDNWPEYYDGKDGRYIGKQARKCQTWSMGGYLAAKLLLENPNNLGMISLPEDKDTRLTRTASDLNPKLDPM